MDKKMFRDYIVLESRVKESNLTIDEMSYNIRNLEDHQRDLYEILDEKNKDIADLHQQLREAEENISKLVSYKAWNISQDLSINQVILEGYDGEKKESNNS